jgi:hypothetical protein
MSTDEFLNGGIIPSGGPPIVLNFYLGDTYLPNKMQRSLTNVCQQSPVGDSELAEKIKKSVLKAINENKRDTGSFGVKRKE